MNISFSGVAIGDEHAIEALDQLLTLMHVLDIKYHLNERYDQGYLEDTGGYSYPELRNLMKELGL